MDVPINFSGKIHGANLTTKPGDYSEAHFWSEFDWEGWIRPQLDYAMSLGCNVVRAVGDVTVVSSGTISQSVYNARMAQVIAYCAAHGIAFYYTGCATYKTDGSDNGTAALPDATIYSIINDQLTYLFAGGGGGVVDHGAHIIGVDIVQEANANMTLMRCANLYTQIRPVVSAFHPEIGCTFSCSTTVTALSWINSILAYCDFLDFHIYPQIYGSITNAPTTSDITNHILTDYPTKDLLFGEGGATGSQGTTSQKKNWLANLQTLGNMAASHVRGAMFWSTQDQSSSDNSQQYGAFDSTWAPRSEIIVPWVNGLGAAGLNSPTRLRMVGELLIWDPTGCTTQWASTKLYRNGAQIANPIYCLYDDSANWPGKQYRYTASALDDSPAESVGRAELIWPGRLPRKTLRRRVQATFH